MEKDNVNKDIEELPDVTAFQDEFTREFMTSTIEISDGYYELTSKTNGYTLPFPGDVYIDQMHYEKAKEHFESIKFEGKSEKHTGESYTGYVMYENPTKPDDLVVKLSSVKNALKYDGEFQEEKLDKITHHYAQQKYVLSDKESSVFYFFGVVESNSSNQYISYRYAVRCPDEEKGCDYDLEAIEKK